MHDLINCIRDTQKKNRFMQVLSRVVHYLFLTKKYLTNYIGAENKYAYFIIR